jgi:hypothetical protein
MFDHSPVSPVCTDQQNDHALIPNLAASTAMAYHSLPPSALYGRDVQQANEMIARGLMPAPRPQTPKKKKNTGMFGTAIPQHNTSPVYVAHNAAYMPAIPAYQIHDSPPICSDISNTDQTSPVQRRAQSAVDDFDPSGWVNMGSVLGCIPTFSEEVVNAQSQFILPFLLADQRVVGIRSAVDIVGTPDNLSNCERTPPEYAQTNTGSESTAACMMSSFDLAFSKNRLIMSPSSAPPVFELPPPRSKMGIASKAIHTKAPIRTIMKTLKVPPSFECQHNGCGKKFERRYNLKVHTRSF